MSSVIQGKSLENGIGADGAGSLDFLRLRTFPPLISLTANLEEKMGGAQVSALTGTAPVAW